MSWKEWSIRALEFILGDPRTRLPRLLVGAGIMMLASAWWEPLVQGLGSKHLGIPAEVFDNNKLL